MSCLLFNAFFEMIGSCVYKLTMEIVRVAYRTYSHDSFHYKIRIRI